MEALSLITAMLLMTVGNNEVLSLSMVEGISHCVLVPYNGDYMG